MPLKGILTIAISIKTIIRYPLIKVADVAIYMAKPLRTGQLTMQKTSVAKDL